VEFCPTGNMLAENFTKPSKGGQFAKVCDILMNSRHNYIALTVSPTRSALTFVCHCLCCQACSML